MDMQERQRNRRRRARRTRARITHIARDVGTAARLRLSVFRSNAYTYVQLIDDTTGKTLGSISTRADGKKRKLTKTDAARELGVRAAELAKALKLSRVIFDRGSYAYHGRVRAVAEGARSGGLEC